MAVSGEEFRAALRQWASGVSIVTCRREGGLRGITVSSFASLSLDPPLILIGIHKMAAAHAFIDRDRRFAVNILREDQQGLANLAAGRGGPAGAHLAGVAHRTVATGAPVLVDCLAWIDCVVVAAHPEGDHTIFIGRVEAAGGGAGRPLLYFRGDYRRVDPASLDGPVS
jgi:flavin reductase (DIM6/NTAB) family NADH-FMN oxidoreductase RutF